jgi:tRNA A37 N6-isopentenylltransferase MiaA
MFDRGLPDEVRKRFEAGYTPRDPGLRAIGYREFFVEDGTSDDTSGEKGAYRLSRDLAGVEALVAQNSRRYAKRQVTFFNSMLSSGGKERNPIKTPCCPAGQPSSVSSVVYYSLEADRDDEVTSRHLAQFLRKELEGLR